MTDTVLIGRGDTISSLPQADWERELSSAPEQISQRLTFMSNEHHLVRNFVVRGPSGGAAAGRLEAGFHRNIDWNKRLERSQKALVGNIDVSFEITLTSTLLPNGRRNKCPGLPYLIHSTAQVDGNDVRPLQEETRDEGQYPYQGRPQRKRRNLGLDQAGKSSRPAVESP